MMPSLDNAIEYLRKAMQRLKRFICVHCINNLKELSTHEMKSYCTSSYECVMYKYYRCESLRKSSFVYISVFIKIINSMLATAVPYIINLCGYRVA